MLSANEKYIDTTNIKHLLAAGEKNIDKIQITLSRYYMDEDLSDSLFTLRAVNSAGKLIMQNLQKEITNSKIILTWTVDETFTAVPGVLALEIIGQMQDIIVIKYEMSPMIVRGSILEQYDGGIDAIDKALHEMQKLFNEANEWNNNWGNFTPGINGMYPNAFITYYVPSADGNTRSFAVVPRLADLEDNALSAMPIGLYVKDFSDNIECLTSEIQKLDLEKASHDDYIANKNIVNAHIETLQGMSHTHDNKTVLDNITAEKIVEWDAKLDADNSIGKLYPDSTHGEIFNDYENNKATGTYSAAMGTRCTANGNCSFAMGAGCTTSGYNSIAMGGGCTTKGNWSFTMGAGCIASGDYSHAEGQNTKASSLNQHVQGKYNVEDTEGKYAFIIGNGISENERSNAIAIDWSGNIYVNNSEIGINVLELKEKLNNLEEKIIALETCIASVLEGNK